MGDGRIGGKQKRTSARQRAEAHEDIPLLRVEERRGEEEGLKQPPFRVELSERLADVARLVLLEHHVHLAVGGDGTQGRHLPLESLGPRFEHRSALFEDVENLAEAAVLVEVADAGKCTRFHHAFDLEFGQERRPVDLLIAGQVNVVEFVHLGAQFSDGDQHATDEAVARDELTLARIQGVSVATEFREDLVLETDVGHLERCACEAHGPRQARRLGQVARTRLVVDATHRSPTFLERTP